MHPGGALLLAGCGAAVARLLWEQEVASSILATLTMREWIFQHFEYRCACGKVLSRHQVQRPQNADCPQQSSCVITTERACKPDCKATIPKRKCVYYG